MHWSRSQDAARWPRRCPADGTGTDAGAGFHPAGVAPPDPGTFLPFDDAIPEVRRNLALLEFLGAPNCGERLDFPPHEGDVAELERALPPGMGGLHGGPYACIHPGASRP